MTRSRTVFGAVLSVVTAGAVVLGTSIPASANSAYLQNDAKSAAGSADLGTADLGNVIDYDVAAYDLKADGYCARAQLFLTNSDGTYVVVSDQIKACGKGNNDGVTVTGIPRGRISGGFLRVWNGTDGPAKNVSLNLS